MRPVGRPSLLSPVSIARRYAARQTTPEAEADGAGMLFKVGDRVLLLERSAAVIDPMQWGIPGGAIEEGEDKKEAAIRETREELGTLPPRYKITGIHTYKTEGFTFYTFIAEVGEGIASKWHPRLNWENTTYRWMDARQVKSHRVRKSVLAVLKHIGFYAEGVRKVPWKCRWVDLGGVAVSTEVEEMEDAWNGGVADLGNRAAAIHVVAAPGYREYKESLDAELTRQLGPAWVMYRSFRNDDYLDWLNAAMMGPTSWTFSKKFALDFAKVAAHAGEERIVVEAEVTPDAVIMRGKEDESELVCEAMEVQAHTGKIIAGEPREPLD